MRMFIDGTLSKSLSGMNFPAVDIVILNHNGRKYLDECIQSVNASVYPNFKIYLLDNASTEDDVAYVQKTYPFVQLIQNEKNNGYCAAYNLAFKQTQGKYFVCLNNDVTVDCNWLNHMVELAESDSSIAAIQPKLLSYFNHHQFEYAGASGGMIDRFGYPFLRGRIFGSIENDVHQYDSVIEIFWATGASIFIRKSALQKSGLFDETIVHHMDEIDLCWRMRMAGYKILVHPNSIVHHIGGATIQSKSFKKIYWNHRNSIYIMLKNYQLKQVVKYVPMHILLDYLAIAQALLSFNFTMIRGVLAAHVWILMNIILILRKRVEVQTERILGDDFILPFMYKRSIVWQHFFRKINYYNQLPETQTHEYSINQRSTQWTQGVTA